MKFVKLIMSKKIKSWLVLFCFLKKREKAQIYHFETLRVFWSISAKYKDDIRG